jgi:hypothetical protein
MEARTRFDCVRESASGEGFTTMRLEKFVAVEVARRMAAG